MADLIRNTFKRGKYQDVILSLMVLQRIDCVRAPTKEKILQVNAELKGKLENVVPLLCKAPGYAFCNTWKYGFESLLMRSAVVRQAIPSRSGTARHRSAFVPDGRVLR